MAWHFARLKLLLIGSSFRRGWQQAVGLILGTLFGVPFAIGIAVGLAFTGRHPLGGSVLVIAYTIMVLGWAVGPLLMFGVDETLDPARLRLLPLGRRQLVTGLLASSAIGIGPLITLIILAGAAPGHVPAGPGAVVAAASVVVQLMICLLASRATTTALSGRLRSRKGRDVLTLLGVLMVISFALVGQVPRLVVGMDMAVAGTYVEGAADALAWFPLSWPAQAIIATGDGRLLVSLGWLIGAVLVGAGLAAWWGASLERAAGGSEETGPGSDRDPDLFPAAVRFLPATRLAATAAKELRYQWRVPQLRANWLVFGVLSLGLVAGSFFLPFLDDPRVVLAPALLATFQGFAGLNAFGGDRGAVWMLVVAGGVGRADIAGKNVASGLLTMTILVATSTALAARTGNWAHVPVAAAITLVILCIVYGVGNLASIAAPNALPESGQNVFSSSTGSGCMTAVIQLVAMTAASVLVLPAVGGVAAALVWRPDLLPVATVLAVVYAAGVWWLGLLLAAKVAESLGPRFVDALHT